jgi:hypothetical protein
MAIIINTHGLPLITANNSGNVTKNYVQIQDKYCDFAEGNYANVTSAKVACNNRNDCVALSDKYCDGAWILICLNGTEFKNSKKETCVYKVE